MPAGLSARRVRRFAACISAAVLLTLFAQSEAGAATAPVGELYVADYSSGAISQYGLNSAGSATPLPYPTAPISSHPDHVIVSPSGKFAYAMDCSTGVIRQYAVDTTGLLIGSLVPMNPPTVALPAPCTVNVSTPQGHNLVENKTGTFVFVAGVVNGPSSALVAYKVNTTTGALTGAGGDLAFDSSVDALAVTPSGKTVYVGTRSGAIWSFAIGTTGTVTYFALNAVGGCVSDIVAAPSGKYLYYADPCTNSIVQYNTPTGAVTPPSFVSRLSLGSGCPESLAITPTGKFLYAANSCGSSVAQISVNTKTGAMTALTPATVPAQVRPYGLALNKAATHLFVANEGSNSVSQYTVASTGQLTTEAVQTVATGSAPWGIAVRK